MTISLRTAFFVVIGFLTILFLYTERAIISPFVVGAIFAYIFNPLVSFFSQKVRIPRILSAFVIYAILIFLIVFVSITLTRQAVVESASLATFIKTAIQSGRSQVQTLPDFLKPIALDALASLEKSKLFSVESVFHFFPQAISRIVSVFIFLISGFYFLVEGRRMVEKLLLFVPKDNRFDVELLLRRINAVMNGYLRGQLFLVVFVASLLFVALSILGVRFALILAIFSGFAEIVPIIGPIVAGAVAALVVLITGTNNFYWSSTTAALVVILIYFVLRQFEDYFVTPSVMGRVAKLHPLVILFAVLSGERLLGMLGLIIAVPIAATIRILLEFSLDKINEKSRVASRH